MITTTGNNIRNADRRHKFDSALAEYVHDEMMDDWSSESRGDAESSIGWFAQIGKRILRGDSQGFVWIEKFDCEHSASMIADALENVANAWDRPEWDDDCKFEMFDSEHDAHVADALAYVAYVYACDAESCDALAFEMWDIERAASPIG